MVLDPFGECGFGAVIAGPRDAAGIFFVQGLRLDAPIRIEPDLMNVSQGAQERIGKAAAKSSRSLERYRNCDRGFHHRVPGTLSRKIQHGRLAWEKTAFGRANHGSETAVAPGFDAFVGEADFIGAAAPRRGAGAVLRALRLLLRTTRAAFAS